MFGSICWYCHWGWPKPVYEVFAWALEELNGYAYPLDYGPAHIVWSDENWEDEHIDWCLEEAVTNRKRYDYTDEEIDIVIESLVRLKAVPEDIRCCVPDDYDGENPENYPPPEGMEMIKRGSIWNSTRNTAQNDSRT